MAPKKGGSKNSIANRIAAEQREFVDNKGTKYNVIAAVFKDYTNSESFVIMENKDKKGEYFVDENNIPISWSHSVVKSK